MRLLDFSDGFGSASEPSGGSIPTTGLRSYANDAAYLAYLTGLGVSLAAGHAYWNSTEKTVHVYDGSAWHIVPVGDPLLLAHIASPSAPSAGYTKVYGKSDGKIYKMGPDGVETSVGSGGGGGSLAWIEDADSPTPEVEHNCQVYKFHKATNGTQQLYALIRVPAGYTAGSPIALKLTLYSPGSSGDALIRAQSTLIRPGTDAINSTTNQRTTTNSAVSLAAGTVNKPQAVSLDIASSSGQINGVSVSAGDLIKVRLYRDTDTDTSDVRVPVYGAEVTFS